MARNKLQALFVLIILFVTATAVSVVANDPIGSSYNFTFQTYIGSDPAIDTNLGSKVYGANVSIDPGTIPSHEFATYVVNGKLESGLPAAHTFIVNETLDVDAYYKPTGEVMVAFIDANQDLIKIEYISSGGSATPPDVSGYTLPGHTLQADPSDGPWSGSYTGITSDTVLWVVYEEAVSPTTHTVSVVNGTSGSGTYNFNDVITVTAALTSGSFNFHYWEIDNEKVSQNPSYSFTVLDNTTVTAVYGASASPSVDGLFLSLLPYSNIVTGYSTWVGQFTLPEGHEMIEYGLITSDLAGGINLDTYGIEVLQSHKYNATTNEFVRHLSNSSYSGRNVRGYMITKNGENVTITYSDVLIGSLATDLYISEYIHGSNDNKSIEIFNGTGKDVDLSNYFIRIYFDGSLSAATNIALTGTLVAGETFVISDDGAVQSILDKTNVTIASSLFDGNDAVTLEYGTQIIDIIGEIGLDPAITWSWNGGNDSTASHTLVRNSNVAGPNSTWNTTEWTAFDLDTFIYLGTHITVPTAISINGVSTMTEFDVFEFTANIDSIGGLTDMIWISSDDNILVVLDSSFGEIGALGAGTATIYAFSAVNAEVYATYVVTVLPLE